MQTAGAGRPRWIRVNLPWWTLRAAVQWRVPINQQIRSIHLFFQHFISSGLRFLVLIRRARYTCCSAYMTAGVARLVLQRGVCVCVWRAWSCAGSSSGWGAPTRPDPPAYRPHGAFLQRMSGRRKASPRGQISLPLTHRRHFRSLNRPRWDFFLYASFFFFTIFLMSWTVMDSIPRLFQTILNNRISLKYFWWAHSATGYELRVTGLLSDDDILAAPKCSMKAGLSRCSSAYFYIGDIV